MSTHHLPYPTPFDHEAAHHEERRRRAFKALTISDVLSQVDDLVASEPDETRHHLYGLTAWLLDRTLACDGAQLFDRSKALVLQAIDQLVEQRLQEGD